MSSISRSSKPQGADTLPYSETRRKLVSAAACCFSRDGFHATSVGAIARAAGVSQGAMYTYFKSKDDLIVALVDQVMAESVETYARPYAGPALDRICQLVSTCIAMTDYPVDPPLWTEILAEAARNDAVRACFLVADQTMRRAMEQILLQGVEQGEFAGIDIEESSIVIFGLIDGLISRHAINPDFDLQQTIPSLRRILSRLLNVHSAAGQVGG